MACTSPVVVRACVTGWNIADERKPFWANFVQCITIDGRYRVSFASLLTSTMLLRPFSWLYLCLHWVVRGTSPHYLVRGRGGSRCRAQLSHVELYTSRSVGKKQRFSYWTVGFWWNFACALILPMYDWCSADQTRSYYLAGSYEQMIGFFTLFRYFFAAISAACGYNWLILCMRGINDVRCSHAKNH